MAKLNIVLLLSLASYTIAACPDGNCNVVMGIPETARPESIFLSRTHLDCTDQYKMVCYNCTHFAQCTGQAEPIFIGACSDLDPANKHCNKCDSAALCTDEDTCKHKCKANFTCTAEGFMPDPFNCAKYHYCSEPDSLIASYLCPTEYVYDINLQYCKRLLNPSDCVTMTCADDEVLFVPHAANKAYYAFCNGPKKTSTVLRCEDAEYEQINVKSGQCVFTCTAEGYFPDTRDCHKYYQCYFDLDKLRSLSVKCPGGTGFNPQTMKCDKQSFDCVAAITPPLV